MREIDTALIRQTVKELFMEASYHIGSDIYDTIANKIKTEPSPIGQAVLSQILENYTIAKEEEIAICQDTGMAILFIRLGQEVHITGGSFKEAINQGVRDAYRDGYLRKSIVDDPLFARVNTKDNTPAIIHLELVEGDQIEILVTPKGFGSENMSAVRMFAPADGVEAVRSFIAQTAINAGSNPCPPVILGVGIGGTMEMAAILAKKATARPVGSHNPDLRYAQLEQEVLDLINRSGNGPAGTGGETTALAVNILEYPTHIAGLPVAVNVCCHAARHAQRTI